MRVWRVRAPSAERRGSVGGGANRGSGLGPVPRFRLKSEATTGGALLMTPAHALQCSNKPATASATCDCMYTQLCRACSCTDFLLMSLAVRSADRPRHTHPARSLPATILGHGQAWPLRRLGDAIRPRCGHLDLGRRARSAMACWRQSPSAAAGHFPSARCISGCCGEAQSDCNGRGGEGSGGSAQSRSAQRCQACKACCGCRASRCCSSRANSCRKPSCRGCCTGQAGAVGP